jgi:hypothetical protein
MVVPDPLEQLRGGLLAVSTSAGLRRGVGREAARVLARAGYRVRRLPQTEEGANPDYEVEGRIFEGYSPNKGTSVTAVVTRMRKKSKRQATRFVVNLDRGGLDAADVREHLIAARPSRLREVFVVKNDSVSTPAGVRDLAAWRSRA